MSTFKSRFSRRVLVLAAALGIAAGASFATAAITSSSATNTIVACPSATAAEFFESRAARVRGDDRRALAT
jgi:hypothetical protein